MNILNTLPLGIGMYPAVVDLVVNDIKMDIFTQIMLDTEW